MGVFPRFRSWINLNTRQPQAESKKSDNVQRKSDSEMDTNNDPPMLKPYYDEAEEDKQFKVWSDAERKHPWHDAPPRIKVTMKKGICHMSIELAVGYTPDGVFELFTDPTDVGFSDIGGRELLKGKSRKVLKEDGPRQIAKSEKTLAWDFLWWSGSLPITLIVDENRKNLTAKYKKEKFMFMKVFEGNYIVEPIYVDAERLCKHRLPKSLEEYKKCSGGQGRIASKVIMNQYFQPYPPFNLPPVSWYIRGITIKTTETLLRMLQLTTAVLREVPRDSSSPSSNEHGKH